MIDWSTDCSVDLLAVCLQVRSWLEQWLRLLLMFITAPGLIASAYLCVADCLGQCSQHSLTRQGFVTAQHCCVTDTQSSC